MKKYFIYLLLILSTIAVLANDVAINECKSDIYFANGIRTTAEDADNNQKNYLEESTCRAVWW